MTIESLLGLSASELEQLKGPDLLKWFGDRLPITRPELAKKNEPRPRQLSLLSPEEQAKKQKIKDILDELGIDSDDMNL